MNKIIKRFLLILIVFILAISAGTVFADPETDAPTATIDPTDTPAPTDTPIPTGTKAPTATPTANKATAIPTAKATTGTITLAAAENATTETENTIPEVIFNEAVFYITDKPANVELPEEYVEVNYTYNNQKVWAAKDTSTGVVLLYLRDQANAQSGLYVYDEASDIFSPFITMTFGDRTYVILNLPDYDSVPSGLVEKEYETAMGQTIKVWASADMEAVPAKDCEFLLCYAVSPEGEKGFYVYDLIENTFQRYNVDLGEIILPTPDPRTQGQSLNGEVENPDDNDNENILTTIGGFFTRIFMGSAGIGDWTVFALLVFFIVTAVILVLFIIYYMRRKREEELDTNIPLVMDSHLEELNEAEDNKPLGILPDISSTEAQLKIGELYATKSEQRKEELPEIEIDLLPDVVPDTELDFDIENLNDLEKEDKKENKPIDSNFFDKPLNELLNEEIPPIGEQPVTIDSIPEKEEPSMQFDFSLNDLKQDK